MKDSAQTILEQKYADNLRKVLCSARKQLNLSQNEVAQKVGIHQSTYSKYESGKLMVSAPEWAILAQYLMISTRSFVVGCIDTLQAASTVQYRPIGSFRIPKAYRYRPGLNVRSLGPLLSFAEGKLGEEWVVNNIDALGVDPSFIVNMDNQLNIQFLIDLGLRILETGETSVDQVLKTAVKGYRAHGLLHGNYLQSTNGLSAIESYLKNGDKYDVYFSRKLEKVSTTTLRLHYYPKPSIERYSSSNTKENRTFLGDYFFHFIEHIANYRKEWPQCAIEQLESTHLGGDRCTYQVSIRDC